MNFVDYVVDLFEKRGWRVTAAVRNVLRVLVQEERFLSVIDINEKLKIFSRAVDPVTIYRILDKLKILKVVHEHEGGWIVCSDVNKKEAHHFLICEKCNAAEEIFLDYKESIAKQLAQEKHFFLKAVDISFYGLCKECLKNNS